PGAGALCARGARPTGRAAAAGPPSQASAIDAAAVAATRRREDAWRDRGVDMADLGLSASIGELPALPARPAASSWPHARPQVPACTSPIDARNVSRDTELSVGKKSDSPAAVVGGYSSLRLLGSLQGSPAAGREEVVTMLGLRVIAPGALALA